MHAQQQIYHNKRIKKQIKIDIYHIYNNVLFINDVKEVYRKNDDKINLQMKIDATKYEPNIYKFLPIKIPSKIIAFFEQKIK